MNVSTFAAWFLAVVAIVLVVALAFDNEPAVVKAYCSTLPSSRLADSALKETK